MMSKSEGMKCYYALKYLEEKLGVCISDDTLRRLANDPKFPAVECIRLKAGGNLIYYIDLEKTQEIAA